MKIVENLAELGQSVVPSSILVGGSYALLKGGKIGF